jgi:ribonucleoside-diphosphate reductase alpha chain
VPDDERCRCRAERFGGETSAAQVFHRMAGAWTYWGWKGGYFDSESDARAFYDEHCFMLAAQMARPTRRNGSTPACTGPTASTAGPGPLVRRPSRRRRPSPTSSYEGAAARLLHQSVADDLVNEGGIMDLWVRAPILSAFFFFFYFFYVFCVR